MGNISLVTRRHGISKPIVYAWVRNYKENGSLRTFPKDNEEIIVYSKNELIN